MSTSVVKRKGRAGKIEAAIEDLVAVLVVHQRKVDWDFAQDAMRGLADALVEYYADRAFTFGDPEAVDFTKYALGSTIEQLVSAEASGTLAQSFAPEALQDLREKLFELATSLPWPYRVVYPVCRFECCPWERAWLSEYHERPEETLAPNGADLVSTRMPALVLGPRRSLEKVGPGAYGLGGEENWIWLHIDMDGYWPVRETPALMRAAAREARSVAGILLACDLLRYSLSSLLADRNRLRGEEIPRGMEAIPARCFAVNRNGVRKVWFLDIAEARVANDTRLTTALAAQAAADWESADLSSSLRSHLAFLENLFSPEGEVLVADKDNKKRRDARMSVRLAAYWYAASKASVEDELASFTFLMLAFEALLGDPKTHDRIQGRLADRAAFLIGSTIRERVDIAERIRDAYRLRSEIFHDGRYDVSPHELKALNEPLDLGIERIFCRCVRRLSEEYGFTDLPGIPSSRGSHLH